MMPALSIVDDVLSALWLYVGADVPTFLLVSGVFLTLRWILLCLASSIRADG